MAKPLDLWAEVDAAASAAIEARDSGKPPRIAVFDPLATLDPKSASFAEDCTATADALGGVIVVDPKGEAKPRGD